MSKKKPTIKERKLVKGIVEGKSMRAAAIDAGFSAPAAREIAKQPGVKKLIEDGLKSAGLTHEKIFQRLNEGVDAMETKFFQDKGVVTDTREVVNHSIRQSTVVTVMKLAGLLVDKHEVTTKISYAEFIAGSNGDTD